MSDRNAILVIFDDAFFRYARACLNSIVENYPHYPEILVLYQGRGRDVLSYLERIPRLAILDPSQLDFDTSAFPLHTASNPLVYGRYLLWTDRFDAWDRVLYLDSDTLVLRPLDELFSMDGFFVAPNHFPMPIGGIFRPEFQTDPALRDLLASDGLTYPSSPDDMVNSGVLCVPASVRCGENFRSLLDVTRRYGKYLQFEDQSAISLWCKLNGIEPRPRFEYNYQVWFLTDESVSVAFEEVAILHFVYYKPDTRQFRRWDLLGGQGPQLQRMFRKYAARRRGRSALSAAFGRFGWKARGAP
jgi:lipopolysaccharide biosynthesis glycosyltransferase